MNILFGPLQAGSAMQRLESSLKKGVIAATNVPDGLKGAIGALLAQKDRVLLVTYNDLQAVRLYEDACALLGNEAVAMLPSREMALYRVAAESREMSMRRLEAMHRALQGDARLMVASVEALLTPMMPPELFASAVIRLAPGECIEMDDLIARLVYAGYERVDLLQGKGQFAARGGIVDVYPIDGSTACRIEFFDDEIDTLRNLDVMTQRSEDQLDILVIPPASEAIITEDIGKHAAKLMQKELETAQIRWSGENGGVREEDDFSTFFDDDGEDLPALFGEEAKKPGIRLRSDKGGRLYEYAERLEAGQRMDGMDSLLPYLYEKPAGMLAYMPGAVVVLDEPNHLRERTDNIGLEFTEHLRGAMERADALPGQSTLIRPYGDILGELTARPCVALCHLQISMPDIRPRESIDMAARGVGIFHGQMDQLAQDIEHHKKEKRKILLFSGGVARGERLSDTLRKQGVEATFTENLDREILPGEAVIISRTISHGFQLQQDDLLVIADSEIYGAARRKSSSSRRKTAGQKISAFTDLAPGDYVVHESHGVGVYVGTVRMEMDGRYRDYLHLRYNGGDKLYVPTDQLDRVQKYIGMDDHAPRMNKLGGNEWNRLKQKVRQSIEDMAEDLVKLYAQRQSAPGFAFDRDTPWQREFEDSFPYEETGDQLQCIEDIKRDMERPNVMDRLLCGDVGYGKTEVALRAAFKAVMSSKQVAILVPTTILAQQHHQTLVKRFEGFPMRMEMLSRFKSAAEQKDAIARITAGNVDIVVGTHRLLGNDVRFKDLGLLVVDEEQRFGVAHKEQLKKLKTNVDVLTLSATPIPRTLHMSMVGIRDMSLLETPPEERYPVQTYVLDYSDSLVRDAILRELARGGQAYVVYNRVQSIDQFHEHLRNLVPEARIVVGHGQMKENALEDVMLDFFEGRYDVLLCSTIIESGLDVPNSNTMIVCEADRFGLSQLYQLRGRVGRSNRLAYCYLTIKPNKMLSETADKRLTAIREFTEFGSGFKIAMRDLEIRGAGNILGGEQHGHMSSVGYDMYVKLMEEAMGKLRGEMGIADTETKVDLRVDAYLPEEYVRGDNVRLEVYKRVASITNKDDRDDVMEELIDRFGDVPHVVDNLVTVSYLKALCQQLYVEHILMRGVNLTMRFVPEAKIDPLRLMEALGGQQMLILSATQPPSLVYQGKGDPEILMREVIPLLEDLIVKVSAN